MSWERWVPEKLPLDKPSAARVYDYMLGGYHNFEIDRRVAHKMIVDIDPIAVAHSRTMLRDNPRATAIRADVHQPDMILDHPEVRNLLDMEQPLGLLLVAILHYVAEDREAYKVVRTLDHAMAPGSYVVTAHSNVDFDLPGLKRLGELFGQASPTVGRSRTQIEKFFDGLELVEPGLVHTPLWRPEGPDDIFLDRPEHVLTLAGVARKQADRWKSR